MANAGEIIQKFYAAVAKKDISAGRGYLSDDLLFLGLFETYHNAEEYIAALTKLLQIVVRLDVKKIIAEGDGRGHDVGGGVTPGQRWKDLSRPVGLQWPPLRGHVCLRAADLTQKASLKAASAIVVRSEK